MGKVLGIAILVTLLPLLLIITFVLYLSMAVEVTVARIHRGGSRWDEASRTYRLKHPLCATCLANGKTILATCVDHIVPHKGDRTLMWDSANWQSLCTHCHSAIKQANERNTHRTVDVDGYPTDPDHLCYKPRHKQKYQSGASTGDQRPGGRNK